MSQKESEWEKEFDDEFDCVMWWGCHNKDGSQKHGYETDCGEELKAFIRKVVSKREKEIAEEVKKIYPFGGHEDVIKKVLQIIKH